ncbi:hypothetical protein DVH24_030354 [Malus domestica]|uniref:F-box domain-containing protein n=1 Tax=Malus domestica TaxID=3750 RepID=A0A498K9B1_MALDO|nr:hypothetical protein DVH24_030354 [Malus domestica]
MKRHRSDGDQPEMQKKTVDAGASGVGGGGEGITCGGCGTPVSMVLDDDHHHVHMDLQELPEGCIANVVSLTTPRDACRFEEVPELIVVWWLDIRGKNDTRILSPSTVYKAYLARGFGRDDPLEVKVGLFGEEETSSKRIVFLGRQNITGRPMEIDETQYPKKRPDGWLEVEIGEFFCSGEEDGGLMEMTCMDVDLHRMKRGLIVQGIEVRPKRV